MKSPALRYLQNTLLLLAGMALLFLAASPATAQKDKKKKKQDEPAARRAYANAERRVETLVGRYGEPAAVSWLRSGLPDDVKNSSTSHAITNNR